MKELKIKRVYKTQNKEDVYNLEVAKNHNYCVGIDGVVSHNCDSLRYITNTVIRDIRKWKGEYLGEQETILSNAKTNADTRPSDDIDVWSEFYDQFFPN